MSIRKLLGPHLGGIWADKLELLREWQPPFVIVLQPEVEKVAQLRAACPRTIITGRFYHDDSHYASNISTRPKEFARQIHQEIVSNPVAALLDYVQSNNEVCQDWVGIQKLNVFTQEWMALADQSQVYKCAILAFSVGNPDMPHKPGDPAGFDGRMLYWQQVLPSLSYAQRNNHLLLLHAYGYPNMFAPDADWYIYRYERQVQANLRALGIASLKYAYGEIGIDRLIVNGKGGYKVVTNDQDYVNQLLQWERDQQSQNLLLGGAIFTFGDSGGWDTYNIASTNVASLIATHYADHTNEYQSPPLSSPVPAGKLPPSRPAQPTGESVAPVAALPPREIDPRLVARGLKIESPKVYPGERYWRLVKARWFDQQEAGGRHNVFVEAEDTDGALLSDMQFLVTWPDGEHTYKTKAGRGFEAGDAPLSPGHAAFNVQMLSMLPSETVHGIGMGADTPGGFNPGIHTATLLTFRRVTVPAATQPVETRLPAILSEGPQVTPAPSPVPALTHPIASPSMRLVSQVFGVNPERYARFGMAGHNGVDYAVPTGTPIGAVDAGVVAESRIDEDGYGQYVKIYHAWGESLYAHLSHRKVNAGESVNAGMVIGRSGNTGYSTGPHLHFGLRVNPYARGWPFDGFSDPMPYLQAATAPTQPTVNVLEAIKAAAHEFGLDWRLLASQALAESTFDPSAVSPAGAQGLMQIMPATWAEWSAKIGAGNDPFDARQNARVGAAYMRWLLGQAQGNVWRALVAYGWGIGNLLSGTTPPAIWAEYANKIAHGRDLLKAVGQ